MNVSGEHGFMGATGILEFGPQFNYTNTGKLPCHGRTCDEFTTCLEKIEENATVIYTYVWSGVYKHGLRELRLFPFHIS